MKSKLTLIIFTLTLLIGNIKVSYGQVSVNKERDLRFGAVMVQSAGSITIAANDAGTLSTTGGIILLNFDPKSSAAYKVRVTRTLWGTSISTPNAVTLSGPNNSSIQITNITNTSLGGFFGYLGTGTYDLYVGGTVNLQPNMAGGEYVGYFSVTVNHW